MAQNKFVPENIQEKPSGLFGEIGSIMSSSMAGLRAGLQQMRVQMRARSATFRQAVRQHSTKAAAATGTGGVLAFAQS